MEKTSEQIVKEMAVAYFNNLRNKEIELIKAIQQVREELVLCAKALDDTNENSIKLHEPEVDEIKKDE